MKPFLDWLNQAWVIGFVSALFTAGAALTVWIWKSKDVASEVIGELEASTVPLGSEQLSLARLFWRFRLPILQGMEWNHLFGTLAEMFPNATQEQWSEATRTLTLKLRSCNLVQDEQRLHLQQGYTLTIATDLGKKVLHQLESKGWLERE